MMNKVRKNIYYVSNLSNDKVAIIDGDNYNIIKEIEIGPRPRDIIVDEDDNVYIASDRNGKVTLIDDLYDSSRIWCMPNNGSIKVDSIFQKIYVCNTEEVDIYNLKNGEKIGSITGFISADSLELDKNKKRLFILDVFENEIKVYDTVNLNLIKVYKNVGNVPSYIFIGKDDRYIYISNKGLNRGKSMGSISVLNIENGNISFIDFPKDSIITNLDGNENFLYAINNGLHRVEVVDIVKRECIANIKTTLPEIQRLKLSADEKILLVTSRNSDGKGVIDRIDTANNSILNTIIFKESNSIPYDIGIVTQNEFKVEEESIIFNNLDDKWEEEKGTTILAKKVLSSYKEKIIFPKVSIEVDLKEDEVLNIEEIIFGNCIVIEESKNREIIENRKNYSILKYDFYIPYYIECSNKEKQKYIMEGRLKGKQKATLYIEDYSKRDEVEYIIKSYAELISTPIIQKKILNFEVNAVISTHAIIEDLVFIPFCKYCNEARGDKKNE